MKNSGLFLNMAKWCFLGLFFEVLILKRFVFGVSGIVSKVLKMLVFFPVFGVFVGWLLLVYLGLEGLGVFVFLVFVFLFCVAFVSVLFALFLFCCWFVLGVGSCFVSFLFLFVFFVFLLFFVFLCLFLFLFFFCFFFLEGLRVR